MKFLKTFYAWEKKQMENPGTLLAVWIAFGLLLGVGIQNVGAGIAVGLAIGVAMVASKKQGPTLTLNHDLESIDAALELHNLVFDEGKQTSFNSKEEWQKRVGSGGYFVVCKEGEKVVGYSVCDVTEAGDFKIWLAGVHPDFRQRGIWSMLFTDITQHAKEAGYAYVLLNTFPLKFPAMYAFLQRIDAEIYKKEVHEGEEKFFAKIHLHSEE